MLRIFQLMKHKPINNKPLASPRPALGFQWEETQAVIVNCSSCFRNMYCPWIPGWSLVPHPCHWSTTYLIHEMPFANSPSNSFAPKLLHFSTFLMDVFITVLQVFRWSCGWWNHLFLNTLLCCSAESNPDHSTPFVFGLSWIIESWNGLG